MKFLALLLIFGFVFAEITPNLVVDIQPISDCVEPARDVGMTIEKLPNSVIFKIASLIPARDFLKLASACKALHGACTLDKTAIDADQREFQLRAEIIINDKKLISPEDIANLNNATRDEFELILKTASIISDMEKSIFRHIATAPPRDALWGRSAKRTVYQTFSKNIMENAPFEVAQYLAQKGYTEHSAHIAGVFYRPAIGVKLFRRARKIVREAKLLLRKDHAMWKMFLTNKEFRTLFLASVVGDIYGDLPLAERLDKLLYLNFAAHEQNKDLPEYLQRITSQAVGRSGVFLGSYMQSKMYPQRQGDTKIIINGVDHSVKFFETTAEDEYSGALPLPNLLARPGSRPYPELETMMTKRLEQIGAIRQNEIYKYRTLRFYNVNRFLRAERGDWIAGRLLLRLFIYHLVIAFPLFLLSLPFLEIGYYRGIRVGYVAYLSLAFLGDVRLNLGGQGKFDSDLDERLLYAVK